MNETLKRRLSPKNIKLWGLPSLVLIDGGKGQLDAAIKARDEQGLPKIPFIGLAKREEQVVLDINRSNVALNEATLHELGGFTTVSEDFILINLPKNTNLIKLLQRIRDESHRFAVTYHSVLKIKRQTASRLDDLPGIGPATRKKLLKTYGSMKGISEASADDLASTIGRSKVNLVKNLFTKD